MSLSSFYSKSIPELWTKYLLKLLQTAQYLVLKQVNKWMIEQPTILYLPIT